MWVKMQSRITKIKLKFILSVSECFYGISPSNREKETYVNTEEIYRIRQWVNLIQKNIE